MWIGTMVFGPADPFLPPQFAGLLSSFTAMLVGSLMPQFILYDRDVHDRLLNGALSNTATGQAAE